MKTETQVQVLLHTVYRKQWKETSTVQVGEKILSRRGVCDCKWPGALIIPMLPNLLGNILVVSDISIARVLLSYFVVHVVSWANLEIVSPLAVTH